MAVFFFFQCSKGKVEEGEEYLDAALREGEEELGLFKGNIEALYDIGTFLGRTHFYIVKIKDPDMFGDPHFETKEVAWMTPEEFQEHGRDLHKPIVKAMARKINKVKNINND